MSLQLTIVTPAGEAFSSADAGGLNARLGYNVFRWLATDLHFEWLHHRFTKSLAGSNRRAHGDTYAFTADGRFFLPRWANARFFALVGVGLLIDDDTLSDDDVYFASRFGGGIELQLTERMGVIVGGSYVLPTDDMKSVANLDYVSGEAGFVYRF